MMETYIKVNPKVNFSLVIETFQSHSVSGDLGGRILLPGIYKATEAVRIQHGDLTLDAKGNENAVWIFDFTADFSTGGGVGGNVILKGNASARNVFWQTEHLVRIGSGTTFKGNILAKMINQDEAEVTMETLPFISNGKEKPKMGWPYYGQCL
jgi:hypothetical protein